MARRSLRIGSIAVLCLATAVAAPSAALARPGRQTSKPTPVLGKEVIGHSVRGRKIVAYHLGDPDAKRTALILGQMHGNEKAGVTLANSIIHGRKAIEGINLWVVPTMNPDGFARNTRQNAHGVDLNRNWPNRWQPLTGQYYSGRRPLSEPETRAMWKFLKRVRPQYLVSLHQPLDGVDSTDGHGPAYIAFRNALARNLGMPIRAFNCWSTCHGSMTGWFKKHRIGIGETIEFGSHPGHAYLVGRARKGIVAALGGTFGSLRAHDPRQQLTITATGAKVHVSGWTYDPDDTGGALRFAITADGRTVKAGRTRTPSTQLDAHRHISGVHGFTVTFGATTGRHQLCLSVVNLAAGADTRTCKGISVQP